MRTYVQLDLGKVRPADGRRDHPRRRALSRRTGAWIRGLEGSRERSMRARRRRRRASRPSPVDSSTPRRSNDERPSWNSRDGTRSSPRCGNASSAGINAEGQMTDAMLADIVAHRAHDGARSRRIEERDRRRHASPRATVAAASISTWAAPRITDRGLAVLPSCRRSSRSRLAGRGHRRRRRNICRTASSSSVESRGDRTGDGALRALAGKEKLRN